jgi:hypothetical protein
MNVPGWGPVVIDLAGLDLSSPQVSLLADHDASLKGIVGHGRAVVRDGKLHVTGTLADATEASKQIIALAKTGFSFQASVGVSPSETQRIDSFQKIQCNGRTIKAPKSGVLLVKAGLLREVSIVVIGADPGTAVSISASLKKESCSMTEDTATLTAEEIRAQATAESERIEMIHTVCNGEHPQIVATAIRDGWDRNRVELEVVRANRAEPQPFRSSPVCPRRDRPQ